MNGTQELVFVIYVYGAIVTLVGMIGSEAWDETPAIGIVLMVAFWFIMVPAFKLFPY